MHKAVGNKKMKKTQTQPKFPVNLDRGHGHILSGYVFDLLTGCIFQKTQCQEESGEPKMKG